MDSNVTPLLKLTDVSRHFNNDVHVLRGVSLTVAGGDSLAIIGPSGCGKSTLLNIIGTLDRPDAGTIHLAGRDVTHLSSQQLAQLRNREIGFVFQEHHLLPQCTAIENVLIPALPAGVTSELRDRAAQLLEQVGLAGRTHHRPGELSGGERQRVAVVRALINQPKLLLADEPTGSLDEASAAALGDLLVEINREQRLALIVVTHAPALAARMARTLRLYDGRLTNAGAAP